MRDSKIVVFPHSQHTVWKNDKFSLTEKNFRETNSLVISLVKLLLSRNFVQKSVRENFRNFHTVYSALSGKMKNLHTPEYEPSLKN